MNQLSQDQTGSILAPNVAPILPKMPKTIPKSAQNGMKTNKQNLLAGKSAANSVGTNLNRDSDSGES